jgi:CDP-6-deoxy-D-xylo-4-hexulose-3-dehydrase
MKTRKIMANHCISSELTHTDNVMNNTFWIGVQPALTIEMLEFAVSKIEDFLGLTAKCFL